MIATLIAGMALAVAQATPETPPPAPVAEVKLPAPADAEAHIRKALAFEARGLPQGRARELKAALAASPDNPIAPGLLGLVDYAGTLKSPDEVAAAVKADADLASKLAEYNARRDKTPEKAQPQYLLAVWCKQNGLADEARAHFTAVTRLKPDDADAWKQLGCKKFNGRWMTPEAVAEAKQEAQAQKLANRQWSTTLARWKGQLRQKAKREEASAKLNGLEDSRAVPAVWAGFVTPLAEDQTLAVQLLGQIDTASATEALATLAVHSQHAEVRRLARETLVIRDPRDYMDAIIGQIHKPLIITGVQRPRQAGEPGILLVEGEAFNIRRIYRTTEVLLLDRQVQALNTTPGITVQEYNQQVRPGPNFRPFASAPSPVELLTLATGDAGRATALVANSSLAGQQPSPPQNLGDSPFPFLPAQFAPAKPLAPLDGQSTPSQHPSHQPAYGKENLTGPGFRQVPPQQFVPIESDNTRTWRNEALWNLGEADRAFIATQTQMSNDVEIISAYNAYIEGVNERAVPVLIGLTKQDFGSDPEAWKAWWADQKGYAYRSQQDSKPTFDVIVETPTPRFIGSSSCFAAGTVVRTRDGSRPIEAIRLGDLVLSQNPRTGGIGYQPVLKVAHNPPTATLKVRLDGGKAIVSTPIHRFWKVGVGWKMARELEPGDLLRVSNGTARVAAIDPDKVQPVFNLEVADDHSFFAGDVAALVHDDSLVNTVFTPFDADVPKLATAAESR
ncbi:Hint domain-containing protein [Isosphaeraceae bacterium EP7]